MVILINIDIDVVGIDVFYKYMLEPLFLDFSKADDNHRTKLTAEVTRTIYLSSTPKQSKLSTVPSCRIPVLKFMTFVKTQDNNIILSIAWSELNIEQNIIGSDVNTTFL
uniref:Uncharacterized protein n=1 Tax=Glossina brevipalpis TaxID=37001 RepID=A0A1A9W4W2_9MUSC